MSLGPTEKIVLIAAITAAVGAVVTAYVSAKVDSRIGPDADQNGTQPPQTSGSSWTNVGFNDAIQMNPDTSTYARGAAGGQGTRTNFNGQIWTKRFALGGNPNSPVNYEQSNAFQSATKNPFANGNNNSYARAVNNATQDPTNQANALVLGPGVAPND